MPSPSHVCSEDHATQRRSVPLKNGYVADLDLSKNGLTEAIEALEHEVELEPEDQDAMVAFADTLQTLIADYNAKAASILKVLVACLYV